MAVTARYIVEDIWIWEKSANIATVVEAIVVTISIIFIWKQLRQQTKLTRIANTQALVDISSPFQFGID